VLKGTALFYNFILSFYSTVCRNLQMTRIFLLTKRVFGMWFRCGTFRKRSS